MNFKSLKRSALAALVLGGAIAAPAQAAFIVSEASVDGVWFNTTREGRGAQVDFIPGFVAGSPNGILFITTYIQNDAGAPTWLALQVPSVTEGQFSFANVPVTRSAAAGNAFGTDTPGVPPATIGTANVTFNSCNDMQIQFTITTAGVANLPQNQAVTLNLSRGGIPAPSCVYTQPFTACPAGTTAVANQPRTCALTGTLNQTVRLSNSATYVLNGKVNIGTPLQTNSAPTQTGTLIVEPGTLIRGGGGALDFLVINPGSRIFAEGTVDAPIIFTGPTETSGSWGGLVIGGLATNNNANQPGGTAAFEADATLIWGGNNDQDSSGVLRYAQIRNGGNVVSGNVELNSLTLGSVGAGTVLEYIQLHNGLDDGVEFFGGAVNAKYLVVTQGNDDGLDFDVGGYRGSIQYAYVQAGSNADTADGSCVESDNNANSLNATPRARPRVANLTCVGNAAAPNFRRQLRIRRGSAGDYFNIAVAQQPSGECLTVFDTATFDQITASALTIQGSSLLGCATNFAGSDSANTTLVTNWFNNGTANNTGALTGNINGRIPVQGGALDGTAVAPPVGGFFDRVPYRGAFGPVPYRDWTAGWTYPTSIRP
jgi:hypothetical protein